MGSKGMVAGGPVPDTFSSDDETCKVRDTRNPRSVGAGEARRVECCNASIISGEDR